VTSKQDATSPQATEVPPTKNALLIVVGALLALSLGVMDQSIVGTAGPTIISDLGGLSLYAWVFSAYVLAQLVSMPILGKLSDVYGRKRFFLVGLVVFILGSILSGASQNIIELIVFRALQGLGGGVFFTVGLAIVGSSVRPDQRSRVLGIAGSIFGLGAIVGPTAGSYLVQTLGWRWIFYVNLPVGVLSLILVASALREARGGRAKKAVDWVGALLLSGWVSSLLLGVLNGGSTYPWLSLQEETFFGVFVVLLPIFLWYETRVEDPVIPLNLFKNRTISASFTVQFVRGAVLLGLTSYISLFVQGAVGGDINDTRNVLYAFVVPFMVGSIMAGQLINRLGYRIVTFVGGSLMAIGTATFAFIGLSPSVVDLMVRAPVTGLGMGVGLASVLSAFQNSVERRQMGVASSLSTFSLTLGGAIGVSVVGAVQVNSLATRLAEVVQQAPAQFRVQLGQLLGDPNQVGQILNSPAALAQITARYPPLSTFMLQIRAALGGSILDGFLVVFAMSVIAVAASLFIPAPPKRAASPAQDAPPAAAP
jgi:EmrB/QacA subfamily drug resistance transporter